MLFMGEEWGASTPWQFFTSHPEPELGRRPRRAGSRSSRAWAGTRAVVPDPQDPETFRRSKLDWAEAAEVTTPACWSCTGGCIALRRSRPELTGLGFEDTAVAFSEADGWLRLRRGNVEVAMNFSCEPRRLAVAGTSMMLATDDDGVRLAGGELDLPGHSAAIISK